MNLDEMEARLEKLEADRSEVVLVNVTEAVQRIVARGEYPSCGRVERELGRAVRHNLNGRDCKERDAALIALGWVYTGAAPAWRKP